MSILYICIQEECETANIRFILASFQSIPYQIAVRIKLDFNRLSDTFKN